MRCVVTGCAGFIGSHLTERLLQEGHSVVGIDCFTDYYARPIKENNLSIARQHKQFQFHEHDLANGKIEPLIEGAELIFHLAAMPGLTRSWIDFDVYNRCNLVATHRLLEAAKAQKSLKKFVYASTSSVYGKFASGDENIPTRPSSPYGITKLAGEQLARVYLDEFQVPSVILRFFSVYGPRQRPEMGIHLFIKWILAGTPIQLTGDGLQVRGATFIQDCVDATLLTGLKATPGEVYNLGGGEIATILDMIRKMEAIIGRKAIIEHRPPRAGDQLATAADVTKLYRHLGWRPSTGLDAGLAQQIAWQKQQ